MSHLRFQIYSILILLSSSAFATESMIRHKYTSCVACHVSPRGGGLLTGYGKMISDSLSAMPKDDQAAFFSGGKFSHALQVRIANVKTKISNDTFPMQADYLAAFTHKKATIVAILAKDPNRNKDVTQDKIEEFYFREAKLIYALEKNMQLTVGREMQSLGLRLEDHTIYNKSQNRFNFTDLTTVAQIDVQQKEYSYMLGLFGPNFQEVESEREYGAKAEFKKYFGTAQIGAGILYGDTDAIARTVLDLNAKYTAFKDLLIMFDGMYTRRKNEQGVSFNQYSMLLMPRFFIKDYWEIFSVGEYIDREAPFELDEQRLGFGSMFHLTKNFTFRFDYRRAFMSSRKEDTYISQIYFNGW